MDAQRNDRRSNLTLAIALVIVALVGQAGILFDDFGAGNSSRDSGSAGMITAAAVSAEIKSQAIMQKMMAAMLRQEAGRVAHDNAIRKRTATFAGQLQNNMTNVLQHK